LVEEHAKLDRVQQIAGIGSIEVDIVTGLVKWSPGACTVFGVDSTAVEPTVEYILSFVHGDDRTTVAEAAAESRALGVAAPPLEYRIIRPDGAVRIVYREYDMQYDPKGRPIRRIMTFQDITQIKATEIRLRQSMEHRSGSADCRHRQHFAGHRHRGEYMVFRGLRDLRRRQRRRRAERRVYAEVFPSG
jgi:PAS domain S-box-containing protein